MNDKREIQIRARPFPRSWNRALREQVPASIRDVLFLPEFPDDPSGPYGLVLEIRSNGGLAGRTLNGIQAAAFILASAEVACWISGKLIFMERVVCNGERTNHFRYWFEPDIAGDEHRIRYIGGEFTSNVIKIELLLKGDTPVLIIRNTLGPSLQNPEDDVIERDDLVRT